MGIGANYVLDKGLLYTDNTTGIVAYTAVVFGNVAQSCARATTPATAKFVGIVQQSLTDAETVDHKGKIILPVRMMGISKAKSGAAVTAGDKVTCDANGRIVAAVGDVPVLGKAMDTCTGADMFINVLVDPQNKIA